jgi:hypothetical protein
MGVRLVEPEGFWEKLGVFLDEMFDRYVTTECDFCKKKIVLPRTLYINHTNNGVNGVSCCAEHAKIMLRHG